MPVVAPVLREISTGQQSSAGSDKRNVYEVSAPEKNGLFWSLMCSYLVKSSASGNLAANIKNITGTEEELLKITAKKNVEKPDVQKIVKIVKNINPFKNAHTLFHDKDLSALMRVFKLRLNRLADELSKKEGKAYGEIQKIQAASSAFACKIDLFEEESGNPKIFIPEILNGNPDQLLTLIIFKKQGIRAVKSIYKMAFEIDYSHNLRMKALKHILRQSKVETEQAQKILNSAPADQFLHYLLSSGLATEVIPKLYESYYALKKLSNAGYDVDPLTLGPDGFSAFYHCISRNDWELLFTLHNHVTKSITTQDFSEGFERLRKVGKILENDRKKSHNFSLLPSKQKEAQLMFSQIQRIIEFQCEIFENIMSITNSPLYQADEKNNRIIGFILSKYDEYFYFKSGMGDSPYHQFLDYAQYYNYHKYIDDFTFLLFFDNFLSLKVPACDSNETLIKNSLIYLIEYLISKNIFLNNLHLGETNNFDKNEVKHFISFCYRIKLKKQLLAFCSKLDYTSSSENISTMDILIKCLKTHPILEEEFQISRFKEYLKTGGSVPFENNAAAPFVVEKTLQVLGETLSTIRDDSLVAPLIKYSFPSSLANVLCDVRNNCLSHLRIAYAQGRQELEKSGLLKKIQPELDNITQTFEAIFMLQTLRVKEHMVEYGMKESKLYPDHIKNDVATIKIKISMLKRNFFRRHEHMYISIAYKIITNFTTSLQNSSTSKINTLKNDYNSLKFLLTLISEYCNTDNPGMFMNALAQIDLLIQDQSDSYKLDEEKGDILNAILSLKLNFESQFRSFLSSKHELDLPNLSELFRFIQEYDYFKVEEKKKIQKSLMEKFEEREKAKQQLIDHANGQATLSNDQIKSLLNEIIASEKIKKAIKLNPANILSSLENINLGNLFKKDEEFFIDFVHILSDDKFRDIIPDLFLPRNLHSKIAHLSNQKLEFLKERMVLLEKILIGENISNWMKYGTSYEGKDHVKRLIRLRYMEEKDTRAALETLLLDCLEILNKRKGFQDLFTKTSNFLCGINLRNFLSHGCPIFETANDYLHPNNLPRELIETVLKLIDDQKVLEALINLWEETKNPKISKLKSIIRDTSQDKHTSSRELISKCDRWENYLLLLPIK